jgi:hypothetical protein
MVRILMFSKLPSRVAPLLHSPALHLAILACSHSDTYSVPWYTLSVSFIMLTSHCMTYASYSLLTTTFAVQFCTRSSEGGLSPSVRTKVPRTRNKTQASNHIIDGPMPHGWYDPGLAPSLIMFERDPDDARMHDSVLSPGDLENSLP